MKNFILYLYGFPGTGKYTIAKTICAHSDIRLVDNHLICNPVFSLIRSDGKAPLPERVWANVRKIREVVMDSLVHIAPKEDCFVLTNVLTVNDPDDVAIFHAVEAMAKARDAVFVPVRLVCDEGENMKRVAAPERAERFKFIKPEGLKRVRNDNDVYISGHKNELTLDVTDLTADDAARQILTHAKERG